MVKRLQEKPLHGQDRRNLRRNKQKQNEQEWLRSAGLKMKSKVFSLEKPQKDKGFLVRETTKEYKGAKYPN